MTTQPLSGKGSQKERVRVGREGSTPAAGAWTRKASGQSSPAIGRAQAKRVSKLGNNLVGSRDLQHIQGLSK